MANRFLIFFAVVLAAAPAFAIDSSLFSPQVRSIQAPSIPNLVSIPASERTPPPIPGLPAAIEVPKTAPAPVAMPVPVFAGLRASVSGVLARLRRKNRQIEDANRSEGDPKPVIDGLFTDGQTVQVSAVTAPPTDPRAFIVRKLSYNKGQNAVVYRVRNLDGKRIEQFWLPGDDGKERLVEQRVWMAAKGHELQVSNFARGPNEKLAIQTKIVGWRGKIKGFGPNGYTVYRPNKTAPLEAYYSSSEIWVHPGYTETLDSSVTYFKGVEVLRDRHLRRSSHGGDFSEHLIVDGDGNVLAQESNRSQGRSSSK